MNTSPLFNDLLDNGTSETRTVRAPLHCKSLASYLSFTTCLKPDAAPPGRY